MAQVARRETLVWCKTYGNCPRPYVGHCSAAIPAPPRSKVIAVIKEEDTRVFKGWVIKMIKKGYTPEQIREECHR